MLPGSCVVKNSQRPASVERVQGGVPPYGVKETLVVKGKWMLPLQLYLVYWLGSSLVFFLMLGV